MKTKTVLIAAKNRQAAEVRASQQYSNARAVRMVRHVPPRKLVNGKQVADNEARANDWLEVWEFEVAV